MVLLFGIVSVQQTPGIATGFGSLGQNTGFSPSVGQDNGQLLAESTNPPVNFNGSTTLFISQPNPYIHQASYSLTGGN